MSGSWSGDVVRSLERRAADRRGDGTYPQDVDAALRADVERRLDEEATHTTALRAAVAQLRDLGPFELRSYRGSNRLKALYAAAVDKVIGHALADIVRQLEAYRLRMDRILDVVIAESEAPGADGEP